MLEYISLGTQIVIAIAALIALKQITISKNNATVNSRRESIRYSTTLVKEYIREIMPLDNLASDLLKKYDFKHWEKDLPLKNFILAEIKESDELTAYARYVFDFEEKYPETGRAILDFQNSLESFAAPFIAGVADEEIAFKAIGRTYCYSVERRFYSYCFVRGVQHGDRYFENTMALYELWNPRIKKARLEDQEKEIRIALSSIHTKSIKPIGIE